MEEEIPTWLTKDYIKTALQHDENLTNISSIENMEIDVPVPKGSHYSSVIFRVQAEYKLKNEEKLQNISLITKSLSKSETSEFVSQLGTFTKENIIYNELLPKYKSLFGEKWPNILAKSFYSPNKEIVILEDLKLKGYVLADRIERLNFEECALALSSLAIFHAASVKLYEIEPELIKKAGAEPVFREDMKEFLSVTNKGFIDIAADVCETRPELRKYVDSMRKVGECIFDTLIELSKPKENEFNVLNHGDFWTGNMMFKYIDNKPVHVIPIDLQICRYATPALDIEYFMNGSVKEEVRAEKYDDLLDIYLDKLNTYLEIFGSDKRLGKAELKKAIDDCGIYGVQVTIGILPLLIADPDKIEIVEMKDMSMDEFKNIGRNNTMVNYFKNEEYLKVLKPRFEEFEKKQWFLKNQ
ncbi:uncharacterized protein LOC142327377 [Lycorma delicatula]|uniref:uncharacterized protein LOC142327377 n=1 Tax=Lycorma delicatula TaxID=130591 RepID=UPI003F510EF9